MSEDMDFIEGCYRLEGGPWQVITAAKSEEILEAEIRTGCWASGVTGMNIILRQTAQLNATVLLNLMSDILCVEKWIEVRGPDSIQLR